MSPRGRQSSASPPAGEISTAARAAQIVAEVQADVRELAAAATTAKPKRRQQRALTQAQLVNKLLKIVGPARPARSSIKISRGPRKQTLIEVLVHAGDEPGLTTVEAVEAKAIEVFDRLCLKYPDAFAGNGDSPEA